MTTVFNLNRYSKIVANDLSLNGSISSALGGFSKWSNSGNDIYFNNGNVGIGTTNPSDKLHVNGNMISSDYNGNLYFGDASWGVGGGNNNIRGASSSQYYTDVFGYWSSGNDRGFRLYNSSNNTVPFFVNSDGNVGVGTTSPDATLEVAAPFNTGTSLYESSSIMLSTTDGGNVAMGSIVGYHKAAADNSSSGWPGGLLFRYKPPNGSSDKVLNDGMVLNALGNVGIGTTNPARHLHIHESSNSANTYLQLTAGTTMGTSANNGLEIAMSPITNDAYIIQRENGNLRFYTNGTHQMRITNDGKVGIGTTSPGSKLHIYDNSSKTEIFIGEDASIDKCGILKYTQGDGNGTGNLQMGHWGDNLATDGITIIKGGNVGIGTNNPGYPLQIVGSSSVSAQGWNFRAINEMNNQSRTFNTSIFCNQSIGTSAWIFTSSDSRIKKDIVEINDDTSLQKIRLLKPSTYKYRDPFTKGDFDTVDGFIAQEVKEVMPHATNTITECIPNIMLIGTSVSDVSNNYIITISTFDTATLELDASGNIFPKLKTYINDDNGAEKEVYVTIKEIVSTTQIKVESEETIPSELYVYGQEVDNMHVLIKDKIFTTGISALQEVDRQQQADKAKIASLESQLADVLQRLSNANI